jgi:hypothetical protein
MSLLVLWYYIALHVLAPTVIIRQYTLLNIFKLLNCALYMVSYNLNDTYSNKHLNYMRPYTERNSTVR